MSNNKPIHAIMSGSYTVNNVATAIKNVAGNIITTMSGSGPIYAPYIPLQTTWITAPIKTLPSIKIKCNVNKEKIYQFAIGKSYEFLFNYMKTLKENNVSYVTETLLDEDFKSALERQVYFFNPRMKLFITEITEECNNFYYKTDHPTNNNDDYKITFICGEKSYIFSATEVVDLLRQQIIRELP